MEKTPYRPSGFSRHNGGQNIGLPQTSQYQRAVMFEGFREKGEGRELVPIMPRRQYLASLTVALRKLYFHFLSH